MTWRTISFIPTDKICTRSVTACAKSLTHLWFSVASDLLPFCTAFGSTQLKTIPCQLVGHCASARTTWCLSCPFLWVFGSSFSVLLTVYCCSAPWRFLSASSLCLISPTRCGAPDCLLQPSAFVFSWSLDFLSGQPLAAPVAAPGATSALALTAFSAFAFHGWMECFAGPPHEVSVGTSDPFLCL